MARKFRLDQSRKNARENPNYKKKSMGIVNKGRPTNKVS